MSDVVHFVALDIKFPERWTVAERMADGLDGCEAVSPGLIGYVCTGPESHDGPHFADGIDRCVAMWSDR